MLSKEELGFHPDFSSRRFSANSGWTFYKSFTESRHVLIIDKDKLQLFDLYDYIRGDYEGMKDYTPCRCIKE
jgi:hypothetical protein